MAAYNNAVTGGVNSINTPWVIGENGWVTAHFGYDSRPNTSWNQIAISVSGVRIASTVVPVNASSSCGDVFPVKAGDVVMLYSSDASADVPNVFSSFTRSRPDNGVISVVPCISY